MKLITLLLSSAIGLAIIPEASARNLLVMQYNENVRIVLSDVKCPKAGYVAIAHRVDRQFMRGCWSYEPGKTMIRVQWGETDFSVFELVRFYPITINSSSPL